VLPLYISLDGGLDCAQAARPAGKYADDHPDVHVDKQFQPQDRLHPHSPAGVVELDRPCQGARIGQRQGRHPGAGGGLRQLGGRGDPMQEGIPGMYVQMVSQCFTSAG
jgi:hypothetical protein